MLGALIKTRPFHWWKVQDCILPQVNRCHNLLPEMFSVTPAATSITDSLDCIVHLYPVTKNELVSVAKKITNMSHDPLAGLTVSKWIRSLGIAGIDLGRVK